MLSSVCSSPHLFSVASNSWRSTADCMDTQQTARHSLPCWRYSPHVVSNNIKQTINIPFTWANPGWIWISVNLDSTQIEHLHGTFHEQLLVWFINSVSWLRDNATQTVTSAQWPEAAWSSCCQQHRLLLFDTLQDSMWSVGKDYWMFSTNVQCLKEKDTDSSTDLRAHLHTTNGHRRFRLTASAVCHMALACVDRGIERTHPFVLLLR